MLKLGVITEFENDIEELLNSLKFCYKETFLFLIYARCMLMCLPYAFNSCILNQVMLVYIYTVNVKRNPKQNKRAFSLSTNHDPVIRENPQTE